MSSLYLNSRTWTVFDPSNADHRRYYYEFINTNTWGRCPVRFVVPDRQGDLVSMIRRSLIDWYVLNEFKHSKKTTRKKVG
jgi:hypothetical protein